MTDNPFLCSLPNKQHEATAKDVTNWKRGDEQRRENITTGKRLMAAVDRRPTAAPPPVQSLHDRCCRTNQEDQRLEQTGGSRRIDGLTAGRSSHAGGRTLRSRGAAATGGSASGDEAEVEPRKWRWSRAATAAADGAQTARGGRRLAAAAAAVEGRGRADRRRRARSHNGRRRKKPR